MPLVQTAWDVNSALPSAPLRYFSYMPLIHSEDLKDQEVRQQLSLLAVGCSAARGRGPKSLPHAAHFARAACHPTLVTLVARLATCARRARFSAPARDGGLCIMSLPAAD